MVLLLAVAAVALAFKKDSPAHISFDITGYYTTNQIAFLTEEGTSGLTRNYHEVQFVPQASGGSAQELSTWIVAQCRIRHQNGDPVAYESFNSIPEIFSLVHLRNGKRQRISYFYPLTGGPRLFSAGDSHVLDVWLPPDTESWKIGFAGWEPSRRQRLGRLLGSNASRIPSAVWNLVPVTLPENQREYWGEEHFIEQVQQPLSVQ